MPNEPKASPRKPFDKLVTTERSPKAVNPNKKDGHLQRCVLPTSRYTSATAEVIVSLLWPVSNINFHGAGWNSGEADRGARGGPRP